MLLSAQHINKSYSLPTGPLHILKDINLDIHEGDVLAIVGPSGAGKSTLLHILGGLDRPTSGDVMLLGKNVYQANDAERSRMRSTLVGFVFQFYHLLPELTALENVVLPGMVMQKLSKPLGFEARGIALLDKVGLRDRMHHRPYELSGGEQQRVAIARALMNQPRIVLCDEPTGNLDSQTGSGIIDILMELNAREKQTLVMVTHDEKIAARAHKIIRIRDGFLQTS